MNESMVFMLLSIQGVCLAGLGGIVWVISDHQDKLLDELRELRSKVGV